MITLELAAVLPPKLTPFASRIAIGAAPGAIPLAAVVRSRSAFHAATAPFRRRFPGADDRAILSYWTQFYFAALIVPALAAAVRLQRILPLDLETTSCDIDADGMIERFWLADNAHAEWSDPVGKSLTFLVSRHLRPFIGRCHAWSGLSRRVLWSNAGVMLDFAARELGIEQVGPCAGLSREEQEFFYKPFRSVADGSLFERRICCLRLKLCGVASCGAACPLARRSSAAEISPSRQRSGESLFRRIGGPS